MKGYALPLQRGAIGGAFAFRALSTLARGQRIDGLTLTHMLSLRLRPPHGGRRKKKSQSNGKQGPKAQVKMSSGGDLTVPVVGGPPDRIPP